MKKTNPVVHFELPYTDAKRVSDFYAQVFGWGMNMTGEDMGNYILAQTTDTDENRMVKTPGTINGGLFPISEQTGKYPLITIQVDNLTESMELVKKSGGTVLMEPQDIPGIGTYVAILDSEGNRVSLLQPSQQ